VDPPTQDEEEAEDVVGEDLTGKHTLLLVLMLPQHLQRKNLVLLKHILDRVMQREKEGHPNTQKREFPRAHITLRLREVVQFWFLST
jgi:hypothetical protein